MVDMLQADMKPYTSVWTAKGTQSITWSTVKRGPPTTVS
jgi:hypothetical protein